MANILIIEDDPDLTTMMAERLRLTGHDVTTAADGESGVEAALRGNPDLIVGDVGLPGMSGFEVLGALRSHPQWRGAPFLFLTASTDERALRHGMNLGADDYLCKPVSWSDLEQAIVVRLERRRQDEERAARIQQGAIEVLTGFAHDVRGPLFVMGASADMLRDSGVDPGKDTDRAQLLDVIQGMIGRMQGMTSDLLTYSRSRLGCDPFVPGYVDPLVLLHQAKAECESPDRVAVNVAPGTRPLWGDELLLRQALRNLLGNALKFTPRDRPPIETGCRETESCVEIWVADRGCGIPAADVPYVFEPFWKGTNAHAHKGTGFGLAIAQSHARRHGGTLRVSSLVGEGTTFKLSLPRDPANPHQPPVPQP